ncbi:glycosyltransferase family 4 protein [Haloimpatiens sp. FM7315]|uniref:glycosyltransferase family 4 protein n=1 Tax=Haloimpatiens sp. FM7315 TaxID=3298609 RepID=UPI0039774165
MKIGIDARASICYEGTGIGTYTYELINNLNKVDSKTIYNLYAHKNECNFPNKNINFNIKEVKKNNKLNFWEETNIPNNIFMDNLSLYHVPQNGIGLPTNKNCPYIITLHDVIPFKMPETVSDTYLKIFNQNINQIISLCDGIITVSNYSKEDIIKTLNYPKDKIYVTYLASESIYKPLNKKKCKSFIKNYYGIEEDFILYIGGFSPRKNISGLIDAFSKIAKKRKIKLIIGGRKGKSYELYKNQVERLNMENKILFPGFLPAKHMPFFYNAAKIFVYPSLYEGFGLPPIEAMACGSPVIASNRTSIPEILGNSAYLINPEDTDMIKAAIIKVLDDDNFKNTLIKNGFIKSNSLNWKKTAMDTIAAYKNTIKKI